jgi:hypothetical protein
MGAGNMGSDWVGFWPVEVWTAPRFGLQYALTHLRNGKGKAL